MNIEKIRSSLKQGVDENKDLKGERSDMEEEHPDSFYAVISHNRFR